MSRMASQRAASQNDRLRELLDGYPDGLFTEPFYDACELVDRYVLALSSQIADELGLEAALARPATAEEVAASRGLQPGFLPALRWLLERLAEAGDAEAQGNGAARTFHASRPIAVRDAVSVRAALLANDPRHQPTLRLLDLAAETYPAVARGQTSGSDALFGLGQVALWCEYFHNDNPVYAVNNRVAAFSAANRFTAVAHPRIVEVGAGAGSATEALLNELRPRGIEPESYLVTEPSKFFRRRGERALRAAYPGVQFSFGGLDIDRPWSEQGVTAGSADLVFGVNVLHVARDLQFSLQQARQALAPGGWLVIGEAQRLLPGQPIWAEFVFQLLEGFTNVETDGELRPTHGFLQPETWLEAVRHAGFSEVTIEPDVFKIREIYPRFYTGAVCGRRSLTDHEVTR